MNLKFTAYSRNERKIYSSGSDPVSINLDGKCINTITGEKLNLKLDDDSIKLFNYLPSQQHMEDKLEDYNSSHSSYPPIIRNTYEDGFRSCFNWIHRIVSKLD